MNKGTKSSAACYDGVLERPRYFPRQLITPADMTLEQKYFRDRQRRHNRLLHGWGVVCGARVCPVPGQDGTLEPWKVRVSSGYILGPFGDEIVIETERTVDLRSQNTTGMCGEPDPDAPDPWCADVFVRRAAGPVYVAVKYYETLTRPIRVQPVGCSCDDTQCEYSRWCDTFTIGILNGCPDAGIEPPDITQLVTGALPDCPSCPPSPWVVLAEVQLEEDGSITRIDNCSCRRMVASAARFWWRCTMTVPTVDAITPDTLTAGTNDVTLTITGSNFQPGARVSLGQGAVVTGVTAAADGKTITAKASVAANAEASERTVVIINPDCGMTSGPAAVKVEPRPAPGRIEQPQPLEQPQPRASEPEQPRPAPRPPRPRRGGSDPGR